MSRSLAPACALALVACLAAAGPAAGQGSAGERHTRHALIIGIGEYLDGEVPPLRGVVHDVTSARRMAQAMAIPPANVTVLRDRDATAAGIQRELAALQARVAEGDRVFVYYSGHGTRWQDPRAPGDGCTEGLLASDGQVLTNADLGRSLAPLAQRADKLLVFYDACYSGGVAGAPFRTRSLQIGDEVLTPKFSRIGAAQACSQPSNFRTRSLTHELQQAQALPQNVVHVAATRPDEVSFDSSAVGGFATVSWRDCLIGQARDLDRSGAVTVDEITRCAQTRLGQALVGQPGVLGQQMTVAGNGNFVPAWMGIGLASVPAAAPLAGAAAAAPAADPAQILWELHGQRDGGRRVLATTRNARLKIGADPLEIDITPLRDGYLYLALAGSDGRSLYLLYPNDLATDNRVRAGRRLSLPGKDWEVLAAGPAGTETLLVMVTDAPRDLSGLGQEKAGPFMRTLLDDQGRTRLQAILSNGTPLPGCGQAGAPSCSDAFGSALLRVQTVP